MFPDLYLDHFRGVIEKWVHLGNLQYDTQAATP